MLEKLQWWNKSIDEINGLIPILTSSSIDKVKDEINKLLNQ
jgi:virginiamycin A acetyltransferase